MYQFLKKTQTGGWMSLGGILLCVTGMDKVGCCLLLLCCDSVEGLLPNPPEKKTVLFEMVLPAGSEAMYADLGHFSQRSIQV